MCGFSVILILKVIMMFQSHAFMMFQESMLFVEQKYKPYSVKFLLSEEIFFNIICGLYECIVY